MKTDSAEPSLAVRPSPRLEKAARAQEIAAVSQCPPVPVHVRPLLGPAWIIEGEDPELYEELLARVGAAVQPMDLIDWLLIKDAVALSWEIQRSRRHRNSMMRLAKCEAMERILSLVSPPKPLDLSNIDGISEASRLSTDWFNGEKAAIKRVDQLLAQAALSMDDVAAQALSVKSAELNEIDSQTERHEQRRDAILQQMERRRAGWAKQVKRANEEVVDAQFSELGPDGSRGETINGAAAEKA